MYYCIVMCADFPTSKKVLAHIHTHGTDLFQESHSADDPREDRAPVAGCLFRFDARSTATGGIVGATVKERSRTPACATVTVPYPPAVVAVIARAFRVAFVEQLVEEPSWERFLFGAASDSAFPHDASNGLIAPDVGIAPLTCLLDGRLACRILRLGAWSHQRRVANVTAITGATANCGTWGTSLICGCSRRLLIGRNLDFAGWHGALLGWNFSCCRAPVIQLLRSSSVTNGKLATATGIIATRCRRGLFVRL